MNRTEAITIRYPATANLMIDSNDRDETVYSSPWNFTISKTNSLLNGFFTRIGTSEVVLEWCVPNGFFLGNISVTWELSGTQIVSFDDLVFYTAESALDTIVTQLNKQFNTTVFQIGIVDGIVSLETSDDSDFELQGPGVAQLGFLATEAIAPGYFVGCPDLRPYRYIDIVSSSLTYNQDLKDSSTAPIVRDVLCRWYFAWDESPTLDGYGFPVLMGYDQFRTRRTFNPPKQIRWDNIQPLGQLNFEVYDDAGAPLYLTVPDEAEFLMTLQISED